MEFLAYAVAFQVYLALKRKFRDVIAPGERWQVIAAAAFGAVLGSRLLGWMEAGAGHEDDRCGAISEAMVE